MSQQVIQWFPGHMAKAKREALEKISMVDIVLELVDARIPESSRNPMIQEIIGNKPSIIVLNKMDMADPHITQAWLKRYNEDGQIAVAIDAQHQKGIRQLQQIISKEMTPYFDKLKAKGMKPRPIRLLILGIPNVGKSTLINRFVGKNQAITGNKPGVTKAQRWLKCGKRFELLDTPGILWPKFEDPLVGKKLALTGAIKDTLLHMDDIALYLLRVLNAYYSEQMLQKLPINHQDLEEDYPQLLLHLTKKMGFKEDYDQASIKLVQDFRNLAFGPVTLDRVEEMDVIENS